MFKFSLNVLEIGGALARSALHLRSTTVTRTDLESATGRGFHGVESEHLRPRERPSELGGAQTAAAQASAVVEVGVIILVRLVGRYVASGIQETVSKFRIL